MAKPRQRIPKLKFTTWRKLGWHVSYRDPATGVLRKHLFNIREREREAEARIHYHAWVVKHLRGNEDAPYPTQARLPVRHKAQENVLSGSLLEIASGLIQSERSRARSGGEPRRRGTIAAPVFRDRKKQIRDFLEFLNNHYGQGAVAKLRIADLSMEDIEAYNRKIVKDGYSASQVAKRIQLVKTIIDHAGRPEHGHQILTWNWDSLDRLHGLPLRERLLPTTKQLKSLIHSSFGSRVY